LIAQVKSKPQKDLRMTTAPKIPKGHCPNCGPDRNADIAGQHSYRFDDDEFGIWGEKIYRILVCRGCDEAYFQTEEIFSEEMAYRENARTGELECYLPAKITHWPSPSKRQPPKWIDEIQFFDRDLANLMEDIYGALNNNLCVPAAIAVRTAFDRATELLEIDSSKSFAEKLGLLKSTGKISSDEEGCLKTLTDAGSAAAHRGWRPDLEQLDTMMSLLEGFVHRSFILGKAANELKLKIPVRP